MSLPSRDPEARPSLCMATAEGRRTRLQGYADAKTIDRALRAEQTRLGGLGCLARLGRLARVLRHVRGSLPQR